MHDFDQIIITDSPTHSPVQNVHFIQLSIMLALCLILLTTYYAQNYAGIIGSSLHVSELINIFKIFNTLVYYAVFLNPVWLYLTM